MQTVIDRKNAPSRADIQKINVPQAEKHTLDNGIPVYAINAGFQDLVKVELLFTNPEFNAAKPLMNSATNRMLPEGTSKYNSQQLADLIDYYGAFFETDENSDFCSVMLYSLNKYLGQTLPYIREMLTEPSFPENELSVYKKNHKQRLIVDNEKVGSLARRKFNQIIFGNDHPYGFMVQPDDYDALNREDLIAFHKLKYSPSNCVLIVSGMINADTIQMLNKNFGSWKNENLKLNFNRPAFQTEKEFKHYVKKDGAIQSAIRIGKPFFNRSHEDYPGVAVANTLLGGYFGSRLMSNIREDKGYTYGIGSAIVSMKQEGYFFISTEVGAKVTNDALREIYSEIELMRSETVEEEELEMVRNYMLGTFLKGIDGAFQLAERFKSIYLSGLDYGYYDRYLAKIRTIGPDEVLSLSRKYFDPAGFHELVVGLK